MGQLTDSTRETFTADIRGCLALSLKLSYTGFSSLADAKRLCQLVLHDRAAIAAYLRKATRPAFRNSV